MKVEVEKMKKNYNAPVQKKGRGRMTNYKGGGTPNLLGITNYNVQNYKRNGVFEFDQAINQLIIKPKGGHGLHKDSSRLQTMTAFNEKFLRGGPGGAVFSKSAPPGRRRHS